MCTVGSHSLSFALTDLYLSCYTIGLVGLYHSGSTDKSYQHSVSWSCVAIPRYLWIRNYKRCTMIIWYCSQTKNFLTPNWWVDFIRKLACLWLSVSSQSKHMLLYLDWSTCLIFGSFKSSKKKGFKILKTQTSVEYSKLYIGERYFCCFANRVWQISCSTM